ncbi:hypothetical protein GGS26DRAFT_556558 [Hypomontagnella submonticulosa]|nr:hypothetical protein GGS26DRAFT_556558 [Hypomontagnella submonticulosa]
MAPINPDAQSDISGPLTELPDNAENNQGEGASLSAGIAPPQPAVLAGHGANSHYQLDAAQASFESDSVGGHFQSYNGDGVGAGGSNIANNGRGEAIRQRLAEHHKRCAANRKRCYIIVGVGITCILVTIGAMTSASCSDGKIQLAVTLEGMAIAALFTPTYANSIA